MQTMEPSTKHTQKNFHVPQSAFMDSDMVLPLARIPKSSFFETHSPKTQLWEPAVDIFEDARQFIIEVELPGIDPHTVRIDISTNSLLIQGNPAPYPSMKSGTSHVPHDGPFTKHISLPAFIQKNKVHHHHENGVLILHAEKKHPSVPQSIKIHFEN